MAKRKEEEDFYRARLSARIVAATYDVNRDPKKRRKAITEEDILPRRETKELPEDDSHVPDKLMRAFGILSDGQSSGKLAAMHD